MLCARDIIEAESPKKALKSGGLDSFFKARGFEKSDLWAYKKKTRIANIFVRRLSGGGGRVWQLVVEVLGRGYWKQVENTLHNNLHSLIQAVSVYDGISEAENPKKVFRQAANSSRKELPSESEIEDFFRGYVAAALWSSHDDRYEGDENLEGEDLAPETEKAMREDCAAFLNENYMLFREVQPDGYAQSMFSAGSDFWLSRCGHGAGYFDGGYGKNSDKLQEIARTWGNIDLYVGDDGLVYQ